MRTLIAAIKMLSLAIVIILLIITQPIVLLFTKDKGSYIIPKLWHSAVSFIFQLRITVEGQVSEDHQTIFMSNHLSYLDIPAIGSLIKASFVAKQEVRGWAVFGFLSTLQQTAFIERTRGALQESKQSLSNMMKEGKSLIIFPEGTSTDGQSVWPFKSSLFSLATESDNPDILVQPVTIRINKSDGKIIDTQEMRDIYAWHIHMDTDVGTHLWAFAKTSGSDITVIFHESLRAKDFENRKVLSKTCHDAVSGGLNA